MQNVIPLFSDIQIPADPVEGAVNNLSRAVLELIRAGIEAEDRNVMELGTDISVLLNERNH